MKDNEKDIKENKNYIVANTEASKVIQVIGLKKDFTVGTQVVNVLKEITFEINRGEFAVIIGASGSGKSTLLHTLLGLEPPTAGSVKVLDTEIYDNTVEDDRSVFRKRHIGMVYQQPNWIRSLSVLENVAFPLILLGIDKTESTKRAWEAIFNVGMREWTNYKPTELSGGQQQKIALARALVINPEIIVADEPTGNLDYESGKNLMEMLVDLNNQGRTIIMVTHDLEYLKYCNTAVRIKDGMVQGVYRGNDVTSILKDSGLGMKRAETKDNNIREDNKKAIENTNTIKAQQVIERASKRVEEMKKEDVTSIQEILTTDPLEENTKTETPVKKDNQNSNVINKSVVNKFKGFFKNKEKEIQPEEVKETIIKTETIDNIANTNIESAKNEIVEETKVAEIKKPITTDTNEIDKENAIVINKVEKIKKPKRRKFKKSKKK